MPRITLISTLSGHAQYRTDLIRLVDEKAHPSSSSKRNVSINFTKFNINLKD